MSIAIRPVIIVIGSLLLLAGSVIKKIKTPQSRLLAALSGGVGLIYFALGVVRLYFASGLTSQARWFLSHTQSFVGGSAVCALVLLLVSEAAGPKISRNKNEA